jgi:hypothetical protein
MPTTIYVYLPSEGTDVWAPVDAEHLGNDVYRITDCRGEDNDVQFGKGTVVRCRAQELSGGKCLVAFEEIARQ